MNKYKDPEIVKALLNKKAQNSWLMDAKAFVTNYKLKEVTEALTFEPNTREFHPQGLFSEDIFGPVTSEERYTTMACINLHTTVIQPVVFKEVIAKKKMYLGILSGKVTARFDKTIHDFVSCDVSEKGAGTGFQFFLNHLKLLAKMEINTKSLTARNNRELLKKYNDQLTTTHVLVLPAGLRDIDLSKDEATKDEINSIYSALISYSMAFSGNTNTTDPLFDDPRWKVQQKLNEMYEYITIDILKGKKGFMENHYANRKIAVSTRNVLTVSVPRGNTPHDPAMLRTDETLIGLVNVIKNFQPFANKFIRRDLFGKISEGSKTVPAINPKTFALEYIEMDPKTLFKYQDKKRIDVIINKLQQDAFLDSHVSIRDVNNKEFYLLLKYETKDRVYLGESIDDFKDVKEDVTPADLEPLTWGEIMYIGALGFCEGRHVFTVRYPANGEGSNYPAKVRIGTTRSSRIVDIYNRGAKTITAREWPTKNEDFHGSISVSIDKLSTAGWLGGDHDGDTVSNTGTWTDEANEDTKKFLNSARSVIDGNNRLRYKQVDTVERITTNLTMDV